MVDLLLQGGEHDRGTLFGWHMDTHKNESKLAGTEPECTLIVKISAGASRMQMTGLHPTEYPTDGGGVLCFRTAVWHMSLPSESTDRVWKLVFFLARKPALAQRELRYGLSTIQARCHVSGSGG